MNGVVSLCHFCELHGPSVILSTQAFHNTSSKPVSSHPNGSFYGNVNSLNTQCVASTCEACHALSPSSRGFLSNDHEARVSFLSTRQPMQADIAGLVRQACVRSLSCEVSPGKEGLVFFGDDVRAHVLSRTFMLKDAQARGFHRWFSIIVLMRDKLYLLHSWPFLNQHVGKMVAQLQAGADKVHQHEQQAQPQRSLRLSGEAPRNKASRSLAELTGDDLVFPRLHLCFTWLLRAGAERLVERLPEPITIHQQDTDDGFTLVSPEQPPPTNSAPQSSSPAVGSLRQLRTVVGQPAFTALVFGLIVGRQVLVRGQPACLVGSVIRCLTQLLPVARCKVVLSSEVYLDPSLCNLLGMETRIAVPRLSCSVLRLDILAPDDLDLPQDPGGYSYKLSWGGQLPVKNPTYLVKILRAMDNPNLSDNVMRLHLIALREEWLNIAAVVGQLDPASDATRLKQALGVQEQDKQVVNFWAPS